MTTHERHLRFLIPICLCLLTLLCLPTWALDFDSGSNGSLGDYVAKEGDNLIELPPDGILHYKTFTVPANATVRFKPNAANTPVYLLAQGDVRIEGTVSVSAFSPTGSTIQVPGPGGFGGGTPDRDGLGPGGGTAGPGDSRGGSGSFGARGRDSIAGSPISPDRSGPTYGNPELLPLVGGSGGGSNPGEAGFPGGGAILMAASATIVLDGAILAQGGGWTSGASGAGSGGAVKLVAPSVGGTGRVDCSGGEVHWVADTGRGGEGRIRIESWGLGGYALRCDPPASISQVILALPLQPIVLRVASVAGYPAPPIPAGHLKASADVALPSSIQQPVDLVVHAERIPPGTPVDVVVTPEEGEPTVARGQLEGSKEDSNAHVKVTLPKGWSTITARAIFPLQDIRAVQTAALYGPDRDQIVSVQMENTLGKGSELRYVGKSGKSYSPLQVSYQRPPSEA